MSTANSFSFETAFTRLGRAIQPSLRTKFLEQAQLHGASPALMLGNRHWTYAQTADTARRWATRLVDAARGRPMRVGVFAYRSETAYLGVLACAIAGAAFVPLNRKFPVDRTRQMIEQADLDALLVDAESLPQLTAILKSLANPPPVLTPDVEASNAPCEIAFGRTEMADAEPIVSLPEVSPDDAAYVLFTSGSTGKPKGVPVTNANVLAFLAANQRRYGITPTDRLSQTFDQTFDLSIFDLFMAWSHGACVCPPQPIELLAPFRFIERNKVTVWFSVPSVAAMIRRQKLLKPGSLPGLRWSLFCGEGLPRSTAEEWQAAAPNSIVENLYGPTELTIACSVYRWDPASSPRECVQDLVPIGKPYEGLSELVVDENLRPVAPGESGELCVAGPQTFPGYWRAPELSAERLFRRWTSDGRTLRYYRTGDLVRRLASGNYAYLGRTDHQVKIGGYRVELGEIEAVLRRLGCTEAAAMVVDHNGHDAIAAFVSPGVATSVLDDAARKTLPTYMVPKSIHVVDPMPLNANGKVNRAALREMLERGS